MQVVIVHHHLNPGGVTRIIASQIQSLRESFPNIKIKLLVGAVHQNFKVPFDDIEVVECEEINYLTDISDNNKLAAQYKSIQTFFDTHISSHDIIHIHNVNLGKNPLVTLAIHDLALKGYKILNHAHDFAEDRPDNWDFLTEVVSKLFKKNLAEVLYPVLPNYMLGVLNSFDLNRLHKKGIDKKRVYLIPNPVSISSKKKTFNTHSVRTDIVDKLTLKANLPIITYPVRVIERKNIGEYILLCTLFSTKANWLVTQPPKNPIEIVKYKEWKQFCAENNIPLHFEVGEKVGFEELIFTTDLCFTTSMREGFGMAYMEPWIMDTPVMGRNLKYITNDLIEGGIQFPYLYDSLLVGNKDFIEYNSTEQRQIITNCLTEPDYNERILEENKHLFHIFEPIDNGVIEHNKEIIRTGFSLKKYAEELYEIYERLVG
jgi:glycosyltransferase involved in cell wall biosynthesis